MPSLLRRIWRRSIWHPDAIPVDEWKSRSLKRVWLPVYDVLLVFAGVWATGWGSSLLNRMFGSHIVDGAGVLLSIVAFVCLLGVSFPSMWLLEMFAKSVLITLTGLYAVLVIIMSPEPMINAFAGTMLLAVLPLPLYRMSLLGEEWKERASDAGEGDDDADDEGAA